MLRSLDLHIDAVFSSLESEFLVMPKGNGFVEYSVFERGYEEIKSVASGLATLEPDRLRQAVLAEPIALVVIRAMLGFTPPEWAYVATQRTGVTVPQGYIRSLDRRIRADPETALRQSPALLERLDALLVTACQLLTRGVPATETDELHRLDKADTRLGTDSMVNAARLGVPYAMLLYERFLGRPFAGHRDSVSELVGDKLESAIEDVLSEAGVSYRKTKRAERIEGFDQAPDFMVPSEYNPQIVIEAKITEDDGTARDKVTRIQHLHEIAASGQVQGKPELEVIACIGGRGFGVRREDMKKLLIATNGKVFTMRTLRSMVSCTRLAEFRT